MPGNVVDASLLGALAFHEPRFAEAVAVLQGEALSAPTLLAYELASTARKKVLLRPAETPDIIADLADALTSAINWVEVDHQQVVRLALDTGLTTYDASYLWVACRLGLELLTFDRRLQAVDSGR